MSEWISVRAGVPIHGETVLTYSSVDGFVIGELHDDEDGNEEWYDMNEDWYQPTHWQYLPDSPKN